MFKKAIFISAISMLSTLSFANEVDCRSQPAACERLMLIDFNGNSAIEESSKTFSDWDQHLVRAYSGSEGEGSTILVGDNGDYNAQGIKGLTPNKFMSGESIVVTFINNTANAIQFNPRISFDDEDGTVYGDVGFWRKTEFSQYLPANGSIEVHYPFDDYYGTSGEYDQVNINLNKDGNRHILVDKIEYLRKLDRTEPVIDCSIIQTCHRLTVVDFSDTYDNLSANSQLKGFDTPIFNFTYLEQHPTGSGVSLNEITSNGESALYAGIESSLENHTFKAGEMIRVTVATHNHPSEVNLTAHISLNDNNSMIWGDPSTWYPTNTKTFSAYQTAQLEFVFDETNAGTYNIINVTIPTNNDGTIILKKIEYLTHQNFKTEF